MSAVIYFFLMAKLEQIIVNIIGRYIAKHEENQLRRTHYDVFLKKFYINLKIVYICKI